MREGLHLRPRRVPAGAQAHRKSYLAVTGAARGRARGAARSRRLHLRRGDGALQLDRREEGRAPQQASVPGRGRALRQADAGQQRRDPAECARHRQWRFRRHADLLRLRPRQPARCLRGSDGDSAAFASGDSRRGGYPGRAARRGGGIVPHRGPDRCGAELRGDARDRGDPWIWCGDRVRRDGRHEGSSFADRSVFPRRVLWAVRALSRGDEAAGRDTRADVH